MSGGEVRKVLLQDIQKVQILIEQCLPHYMSQKEVTNILLVQEKIEPSFTELVWQKLEEQNQEFFRAYHLRLMVKEQIMDFNKLLGRQVELMHQVPRGVSFNPMSNGSHIPPMHQSAACYAQENSGPALNTENMHQPVTTNLPGTFTNCGSPIHPGMQTAVDMSAHSRRIDVPPNILLAQSSNVGMVPGMNGGAIKTEAGYLGSSRFIYGAGGNVLETRAAIGDASVSSYSSVESNSQPLNETLLDDTSSFGLLGHISRDFSLSDLTADFANSSDILESYSRSPFTDNFLDSHGGSEGHHGDNRRLDTISEGLTYDDFGSD